MPPPLLAVALGGSILGSLFGLGKKVECPEPRQQQIAVLLAKANGDVTIILARMTERLSTEDVACWAATRDKPMMLELAKRLESGDGVAEDRERAEDLYQAAAAFVSGTTYVYSPPVGKSPGQVIPIRIGPDVPGLPEATYRRALMHIQGRAVEPRPRKGFKWLRELAKRGYAPAIDYLARAPRT